MSVASPQAAGPAQPVHSRCQNHRIGLHDANDPQRAELEQFVKQAFASRHSARVCTFMPTLLSLRNDVGLLAEEYDPRGKRQLGNFPQAFSHVGLVNAAHNLIATQGPAEQRADQTDHPASVPQDTNRLKQPFVAQPHQREQAS